jgi:ABC-type molybdenum transport system ATPase subunit/photorepair protein PhrA
MVVRLKLFDGVQTLYILIVTHHFDATMAIFEHSLTLCNKLAEKRR